MIIIVHEDKSISNKLESILFSLDDNVLFKSDLNEALSFIEIMDEPKIIISSLNAFNLAKNLEKKIEDIKLIVLNTNVDIIHDNIIKVPSTSSAKEVVEEILKKTSLKKTKKTVIKHPLVSFKMMDKFPVDVYVKTEKIVKIFKRGDLVEGSIIDSYLKKFEHILVLEEDFSVLNDLMNKIYETHLFSNEQISVDVIIKSMGVDPAIINRISNKSNELLLKIQNGNLKNLLKDILIQKNSVKYKKSYITSLFINAIANEISFLDNKKTNSLLSACFLNDTVLSDEDLLEQNEYNKNVRNHALDSFRKLESNVDISQDTLSIIKQHHGSIYGVGFYKDLKKITELSKIFISCEELSMRILKSTNPIKINELISEISAEYIGQLDNYLNLIKKCLKLN